MFYERMWENVHAFICMSPLHDCYDVSVPGLGDQYKNG